MSSQPSAISMSRPSRRRIRPRVWRSATLRVAVVALPGGLVLMVAMRQVGVAAALVVALGIVLVALLTASPPLALALLLVPVLLVEAQSGVLGSGSALYDSLPIHTTPVELLLVTFALATLVDAGVHPQALRSTPLSAPLALLLAAALSGMLVGLSGGGHTGLVVTGLRTLLYLIVLPPLIARAVHDPRRLRLVVGVGAALIIVKAVLGLVALRTGQAPQLNKTTFTYYEPTLNFLMMLYLVVVLGALLRRVRLPWWVWAGAPFVFAALLLSYRRGFWIGASVALLLVLILASGRVGRPLLLLAAGILGLGLALTLSTGTVTEVQLQGPIAQRVQSLVPSRLTANKEDRYRLDERRNVLAEISRHPITGLGLDVPWKARYALPVEHVGGRDYTHIAALWYWLKLGLLGFLAYLALVLTAVVTAYRTWRRHADPFVRVLALAAATGLIGLMLVETTGTFIGVDARFTIVFGALLGLVVAADRQSRHAPVERPPDTGLRATAW